MDWNNWILILKWNLFFHNTFRTKLGIVPNSPEIYQMNLAWRGQLLSSSLVSVILYGLFHLYFWICPEEASYCPPASYLLFFTASSISISGFVLKRPITVLQPCICYLRPLPFLFLDLAWRGQLLSSSLVSVILYGLFHFYSRIGTRPLGEDTQSWNF